MTDNERIAEYCGWRRHHGLWATPTGYGSTGTRPPDYFTDSAAHCELRSRVLVDGRRIETIPVMLPARKVRVYLLLAINGSFRFFEGEGSDEFAALAFAVIRMLDCGPPRKPTDTSMI